MLQLQKERANLNIPRTRSRIQQQHIMAGSTNVSLIRWYFHLMPLNSFHRCSHFTPHVSMCYRQGQSFPIRHSSWTVLTALLWLHCQLLLSCSVAFDMIVERCQKFGGLTLGRKPNKKTRNKRNKTYCKSKAPWKWNKRVSVTSILLNSLNFG